MQVFQLAHRAAALLQPPPPSRSSQPSNQIFDTAPGFDQPAPDGRAPPLVLPPPMFNQQWRDFLVAQQLINDNYQTRNRQESRVLLPATVQVPADIQDFQFLPDRLKIFVTVGRGGWAAALTALPDLELQQLGVQLPPPAPVLHLPPAPAPSVQYAGSVVPGPAVSRCRRRTRQAAAAAGGTH